MWNIFLLIAALALLTAGTILINYYLPGGGWDVHE